MTPYQRFIDARDFLQRHRSDYDTAWTCASRRRGAPGVVRAQPNFARTKPATEARH
jgi:hypothetical protein